MSLIQLIDIAQNTIYALSPGRHFKIHYDQLCDLFYDLKSTKTNLCSVLKAVKGRILTGNEICILITTIK